MTIKEYIQDNILLVDGAMGTYYRSIADNQMIPEEANVTGAGYIKQIHHEYIEAGAKLIRTNTFAANQYALNIPRDSVEEIIKAGYGLAYDAAVGRDVFIACSIGEIRERDGLSHEDIIDEYRFIIDCFIGKGAKIFWFETLSQMAYIKELVAYILKQDSTIEVVTTFAINVDGYTKKGINQKKILDEIGQIEGITAYGFNCSIGAGHMLKQVKKMPVKGSDFIAIPNASYPEKLFDRTVYVDNTHYFAGKMIDILKEGVKIIGGCCGTTPKHIQQIASNLAAVEEITLSQRTSKAPIKVEKATVANNFYEKLKRDEFVIAVELDPPFKNDATKLIAAASILKDEPVDLITLADSPLGRMRLDSIIMANKIKREVGIDVLPHICCRDKNTIALRSMMLAAHVEGIRNLLLVTGDPIPEQSRDEINGVFNLNSIRLMELVKGMNEEIDVNNQFVYGGALNPKVKNIDKVIERVKRKKEAGALFLLTQPIYSDQAIENMRIIKEATGIKILGGIMPLVSYKNAIFLHNEFPGMHIEEKVINSFSEDMTREEAETVGVDIAIGLANKMKSVVDGLYLMTPFNRATMIQKILRKIDL